MHARLFGAAFLSVTFLHAPSALAQNPTPAAAGSHKHYESGGPAAQPGPNGEVAPRLQNLGSHTFPVSTRHVATQRFINQGLNLAYAFNHAEARRAFREAARLSPKLAMAYAKTHTTTNAKADFKVHPPRISWPNYNSIDYLRHI